MNPDKFRNTNALWTRPSSSGPWEKLRDFKLQINDSEGFLAFVETLKTDRSKACMSVPTQVGARSNSLPLPTKNQAR